MWVVSKLTTGNTYTLVSLGSVVEAFRHAHKIREQIGLVQSMSQRELYDYARSLRAPLELLQKTAVLGRLPVVNFAAGGLGSLAAVFICVCALCLHRS